jgi:membrane associated rhomboid family serine protease
MSPMRPNWYEPAETPAGGGGLQYAMPPVTTVVKRLILANAAVFLVCWLSTFQETAALWAWARDTLGLDPSAWVRWFPLLPVWQLLTYGFLHDVNNLFHLLGNMLFLYFLGTLLEGIVGARRFLTTYLAGLLAGGLGTLAIGLAMKESRPTIGASGAVLAVVVATAVLRPNTRVIFIIFPITLKTLAIIYVGLDVFYALSEFRDGGGGGNVARFAHLAGAAYGFFAARRGWVWRDPLQGVADWRARREVERERTDRERVDQLLAKINREGIQSLSSAERAFLKRASKRK